MSRTIGFQSSECEAIMVSRTTNLRICLAHLANHFVHAEVLRKLALLTRTSILPKASTAFRRLTQLKICS